jgi:formylmethanofuran dehydrogenase subunit C
MRGGSFIVKGNAGERFGDRMRRGTALVFGNAGDFLASRLAPMPA